MDERPTELFTGLRFEIEGNDDSMSELQRLLNEQLQSGFRCSTAFHGKLLVYLGLNVVYRNRDSGFRAAADFINGFCKGSGMSCRRSLFDYIDEI